MIHCIVKKELLPSIRNDEKFINAIQLSRVLSSLRYNLIIYARIDKEANVSLNVKLNNFLNQAALLCEGVRKLNELEATLKELKSFQENIDKIEKIFHELEDDRSFLKNVLCRVRNKIVFHFDRSVTKEIFEEIIYECTKQQKDVIFASGKTDLVKDMTFDLADNIDINYILKFVNDKKESASEKFKTMVKELLRLSGLFCAILEDLIGELIKDYCELKEED